MNIHCLQHVPFETPGHILTWAQARGHTVTTTRLFAGEALPPPAAFDWLVIMGGPMGVYDDAVYSWLQPEKQFLHKTIHAGRVVLGICLGAQLLADALGARVTANAEKEIGWFPVRRTATKRGTIGALDVFPESLDVLHWHGDTFDIPPGAVHALASDACPHQAFVVDQRLYGLQFHLEVTPDGLRALIENCRHELAPNRFVQSADELLAGTHRLPATHALLDQLLDRIATR